MNRPTRTASPAAPMSTAPTGNSGRASDIFAPLVALLAAELRRGGDTRERHPPPTNLVQFTAWYLATVQRLEQRLGEAQSHGPMSRREVELQCRLALSASNLEEAIQLCAEFAALLHPRAGRIGLELHPEHATFRLDSLRPQVSSASSLVDITGLFAYFQLLQWLAGRTLPLQRVRIGPLRREDVLPFLRLFKAPVLAGGEGYALDFPRAALAMPVVRTPAEFPAFFACFPCEVFGPRGRGLAEQVSALLAAALRQGVPLPGQARLAEDLGLSLSTFRQRLRAAGTGYRQLRAEAVRATACDALRESDRPVVDIAQQLGFADAATFRRAFLRWEGETPGAWRARHRGSDTADPPHPRE
ncbi:AraC family transcriptional regulator [Haliea sp.]|uniref:helix-turn-helix domain-containing protein n=1 Tax=Haliea sp. TaxID=1932666 RepID=UPI0025C6631C|nr:AraC family transcriptional regulator [Haliea sp.]